MVRPEKGIKLHDTLTRLEYKEDDGILKRKTRLCARGDQQVEGVSYDSSDLHAPSLKVAPEARMLAAITAEHGCPLLKPDTRQAFLNGGMG